MREQDELTKGKSDWMNYQQKKSQIKDDRKLDQEHNENIAKRKLRKQPNPNGGIQLG